MSKPLTADQLIESIKRRASIPTSQDTFTDEDLLEFANEELQLGVVPGIMSVHEDHLLFEEEVAIEANRSDYEIPHRALGNKLRDVQFKVGENNLTELTRIGIGERFSEYSSETNIRKFYVKGNKVVLNSSVGAQPNGSLVFVYYIRPSSLVKLENVGVIQGIVDNGDGTSSLVVSNIPSTFTTSITYDLYKADSPSSILKKDLTSSNIDTGSKSIKFNTADMPQAIAQIPTELHPLLAEMVACRVLEALGDTQALQNALIKVKQMQTAAGMLIDSRIDDAPQKVVNRHGLVRTGVFSKRFNRR
jgi:hypothetical protein